jgi:hypothetical protein
MVPLSANEGVLKIPDHSHQIHQAAPSLQVVLVLYEAVSQAAPTVDANLNTTQEVN